tara:strand:+ start:168 stop:395 length:228 start_codon:yes stop_codon:yes gene_type:complete
VDLDVDMDGGDFGVLICNGGGCDKEDGGNVCFVASIRMDGIAATELDNSWYNLGAAIGTSSFDLKAFAKLVNEAT